MNKNYPYNLIEAALGSDASADPRLVPSWLRFLSEREHDIIQKKYQEGQTLEEIAKEYGVTRERIRQFEAKALRKLAYPPRAKEIKTVSIAEFEKMKAQKTAEFGELYKRHTALQDYVKRLETALAKEVPALSETIGVLSENYFAEKPEVRDIPLEELDLSFRSYNCLARAGIKTARDIESKTADEMMRIRNLGRHSMQEISGRLKELDFEPKF